jgi:hypothetical protein
MMKRFHKPFCPHLRIFSESFQATMQRFMKRFATA